MKHANKWTLYAHYTFYILRVLQTTILWLDLFENIELIKKMKERKILLNLIHGLLNIMSLQN